MSDNDSQASMNQVRAMLAEARRLYEADLDSAALAMAARAAEMAEAGGWPDIEYQARLEMSRSHLAVGECELAAAEASNALALAEDRGNAEEVAIALVAQAAVSQGVGDFEQALRALERAWPALESSRNLRERFRAEHFFARAHGAIGDHAQAIEWHSRRLDTARASGVDFAHGRALCGLAAAWLDRGDDLRTLGDAAGAEESWSKSIEFGRIALDEVRAGGWPSDGFVTISNLAAALARVGQLAEALTLLDAASAQSAANGGFAWAASTLTLERGRVLAKLGRAEEAEHEVAEAIASAEPKGFTNGLDDLYALKSSLAEGRGALPEALADLKRSHAVRERIRSDRAQLRSRVLAAQYGVERARKDAEVERQRAQALVATNQALEARATSLQEQAQVDALTGVANRRHLDTQLAIRHADAHARGMPLCVAMIDVDHFKQVNDRYSHSVGDAVLRELALALKQACRGGDLVARYGGEEFTVVFADVGLTVAARACERLRAAVEATAWARLAPGLSVTISIGLADIGSDPDPLQGLHRADALLYRAKADGRNRVAFLP